MKVPKYVVDIMGRAKYNYTASGENYSVGYTVDIYKYSHYEYASSLENEVKRLVRWANNEYKKLGGESEIAFVLNAPKTTLHKYRQYATVTIFDPVMKYIEQFIKEV